MLESELFALLEHTSDAAFVLSNEGTIQYWNKAAERLLGYSNKEVLHKACDEVFMALGHSERRFAMKAAQLWIVLANRPKYQTLT
jgi:PAS domain S-box-containing protein